MQIGPNGTRCLRQLGLYDDVATAASVPGSILVHDGGSGAALTALPLGARIAQRHGAPYWVVHRSDLVQALYRAACAAGIDVRFDVDVVAVHDVGGGVEVETVRGERQCGAGVVGADGVWSRVRDVVFGDAPARATGRVAMRAMLAGAASSTIRRDAVSVWMVPDAHLVAYPVQRGQALNIVLIARGAHDIARWSTAVDSADVTLAQHFSAFSAPVRAALHMAEPWRQWPLVSRVPLSRYDRGRVVLIGDAAHPMQPFLAQGAVMALEDAVVLAACVARSKGDVAEAFSAFSTARLARTQRVAAAAERNGRIYHLDGAMALARNATLRLTPPSLIMRGYDWLYGA